MPDSPTEARAIGIDLGTTHSVLAYLDADGRPCTVASAEGDLTTPSVVWFEADGRPVVGREAVRAAVDDPRRIAQFAKRSMGESWCEQPIGGCRLPPEVVQALILRKLRSDAEPRLGPIHRAVITVPAYFNEPRRKATQDAGRLAGIEVLDIINEPTAAALAYGIQRGFLTPRGESPAAEAVLVYDLGGGTFDVTLMRIDGNRYTTLATAGDVFLGGIDWDQRLADFAAEAYRDQHGTDPRESPGGRQALLIAAAEVKHALTAREQVQLKLHQDGRRFSLAVSRAQFRELTEPLLLRTQLTVRRVLREAGIAWNDVTRVLLVGGATRMPMISEMLQQETDIPIDRSLSPDEAVAHGAALYAGFLQQGDAGRLGLSVTNVNSHDLGVLAIEPESQRPRRRVLIDRNTPLPATGIATFGTRRDGQRSVLVTVIEGGDAAGHNAATIGRCIVSDLPADLPARTQVEVRFHYATNGRLEVAASLPGVERQAAITIERRSGMDAPRLEAWQTRLDSGRLLDPPDAPQAGPAADPGSTSVEQPAAEAPASLHGEDAAVSAPAEPGTMAETAGDAKPQAAAADSSEPTAELISIRVRGASPSAKTVDKSDPTLQDFLKGIQR